MKTSIRTTKELMRIMKKDVRILDFVTLEMAHLLPRLVAIGGRLFAEVYYYPVWQGDGPQTLRPLRVHVRYDLAGKRPVLLEELPETSCSAPLCLWSMPEEGKAYAAKLAACVHSSDRCLQEYESSGAVSAETLEEAERDWLACVPVQLIDFLRNDR